MSALHNFGARRYDPVCEQSLSIARRTSVDELPIETRRRAEERSGPGLIGEPRQLNEQLIPIGALHGNQRLEHAQLVDATIDCLPGLRDDLIARDLRIAL